jgi:hypothetical protein
MRLTIIRIKPNPVGKDRVQHGNATPAQLAGEWVDFRNDTGADVSLDGASLWHLTYAPGRVREWEQVASFAFILPAGKIARVHSGQRRDISVVRPEDRAGADLHVFTGKDAYVWNNEQGDTPLLFKAAATTTIDKASYDRNPPEGAILTRQGDKLVPSFARAANW